MSAASGTTPTVLPTPEPIEEDDEFEEFQEDDWDVSAAAGDDAGNWAADWEDEDIETDFDKTLKEELAKARAAK